MNLIGIVIALAYFGVVFGVARRKRLLGGARLNEEEVKRKKRERDNEPGLKLHRGMRAKGMPEGKTFITKLSGDRSALIRTAQNLALGSCPPGKV
jgi:hypothetical protein